MARVFIFAAVIGVALVGLLCGGAIVRIIKYWFTGK